MDGLNPNIITQGAQNIDPIGQTGRGIELGSMIQKQQEQQQQRQDQSTIQDYLKQGGSFQTPEGLSAAAESLKGRVSPKTYEMITQGAQEMETNRTKQAELIARATPEFIQAGIAKHDFIAQNLQQTLNAYKEAAEKGGKGSQGALQDFEKAKQQVLQSVGSQLGPDGKPMIDPKMLQEFSQMSPPQVEAAIKNTQYSRQLFQEGLKTQQIQQDIQTSKALEAKYKSTASPLANVSAEDIDSGVALYKAGVGRKDIVSGSSKEANAEWNAIRTAAAKQLMEENPGMTEDQAARQLASGQAGYGSTKGALNSITKDLSAVQPYKQMLDQNVDIAIDLSKKVVQSDSRLANKSINWVKQNMGDNPDTAEFLAQMRFVQTEAARVINNPRLTGQVTVSAQDEMDKIVSGDMPVGSLERVLRRIQNDGKRRVEAMQKQREQLLKGEISMGEEKPAARSGAAPTGGRKEAPSAAIEHLKANPALKEQFRQKYGYVPEGI